MDLEIIKQWIGKNNIQVVLFDLDDTLVFTAAVFTQQCDLVRFFIAQNVHITEKTDYEKYRTVYELWEKAQAQAYRETYVNPKKFWLQSLQLLNEELPLSEEVIQESLNILNEIYSITPKPIEGAFEFIQILKQLDVKIGLVTHAESKWTYDKLNNTIFNPKLFDEIIIVEVDKEKTYLDWANGVAIFGVYPEYILAVGNSIKSDIMPAIEAGIKHSMLVRNSKGWHAASNGDVPKETLIINDFTDVTQVFTEQLNENNELGYIS